ncbi:MAG: alpha/beta hydrolase [Chitinophagaceae bacterium]
MKKLTVLLLPMIMIACSTSSKKEHPIVKNGNVQIAYIDEGNGDTTLLFIHGWAINKEFWQKQIEHFSKRYRVVAIDLGGHGASGKDRSSWTIPDYSNDVVAVIQQLHLDKVVLIGHSMSGEVMLQTVKNLPQPIIGIIGIDNLTSIDPKPFTEEQMKPINQWFDTLAKSYDSVAADYCRKGLFPPGYQDTASINRVIRSVTNMDSMIAIATLKSLMEFTSNDSALLANNKLRLNLVISSGNAVDSISLNKYCKNGFTIRKVIGTGHYPMIEKPDEFNARLQETLDHL